MFHCSEGNCTLPKFQELEILHAIIVSKLLNLKATSCANSSSVAFLLILIWMIGESDHVEGDQSLTIV